MADLSRSPLVGTSALLAILVVGLGGSRVGAQYAPGFGLNGSPYPFYTPGFGPSSETQYLFGHAESLTSHYDSLFREHSRRNVDNPRDFKHFTRQTPYRSRPAPPAESPASTAPPQSSNPPTIPDVELGTFLGPDGHVDWPRDVPGSPDLDARRDAADEAIRAAAAQIKEGRLSVQALDLARVKLIAFGRPSLAKVRAERSPRVADSFHSYLRQLLQAIDHAAPVKAADEGAVASLPANR